MLKNNFIISNIILTIGILVLISGLAYLSNTLFVGIYIILGTLSYRSLKKRKLGIVSNTKLRFGLEVILIVVILLLIIFQNDLLQKIINDPFSNVLIPLSILFSYIILFFKNN